MELTQEEFNIKFSEGQNAVLKFLAFHPDISPDKFYRIACILENLACYSPVLFELLKNSHENEGLH